MKTEVSHQIKEDNKIVLLYWRTITLFDSQNTS